MIKTTSHAQCQYSKEAARVLADDCFGKKPGSPVFTLKDSNGNDMDLKDSVKTVQRLPIMQLKLV
jgi:hypothetical protein